MSTVNEKKERICSVCGLPKPKGEFVKSDKKRCRNCRGQFWQVYKKARKQRGRPATYSVEVGIETWGQVDSLIREMAESQFRIHKEYMDLERRIALLKKCSDGTVEPEFIHQINFRSMLKTFLKKKYTKGQAVTQYFNFGIVRFHRGKLDVELDAVYAGQRMDKP